MLIDYSKLTNFICKKTVGKFAFTQTYIQSRKTSPSTTTYTNSGLNKNKTYYYKVRAYKNIDSSTI